MRANKACTRQVGFCGIFRYFLGFGIIHASIRVHSRLLAGNANRSADENGTVPMMSVIPGFRSLP